MKLVLVRHGHALDERENSSRPLSELGHVQVEKSANFIKNSFPNDYFKIIHGPKLRAKESAEIINSKLTDSKIEVHSDMLPESDVVSWENKIINMRENVILVGHLPFLEIFLNKITYNNNNIDFKTATTKVLNIKNNNFNLIKSFTP